jgi:hypothetical protein
MVYPAALFSDPSRSPCHPASLRSFPCSTHLLRLILMYSQPPSRRATFCVYPQTNSGSWKLLDVCVFFAPSYSQTRLTLSPFIRVLKPGGDLATPSLFCDFSHIVDEIPLLAALPYQVRKTHGILTAGCLLGASPYSYDACTRTMNESRHHHLMSRLRQAPRSTCRHLPDRPPTRPPFSSCSQRL